MQALTEVQRPSQPYTSETQEKNLCLAPRILTWARQLMNPTHLPLKLKVDRTD